jgi:cellulose synthase/poly-beta-1,6-N-acetylglucosamine synthase-like glycosyltransferase
MPIPEKHECLAVVVIGRNESGHLQACLDSVRAMDYPADLVELVYVDSDSTDSSREIAAAAGAKVIHLTGQPMTAARGRNAGWTSVSAPLILFLDGDTQLHPQFVPRAVAALEDDENTAAVWGHRRESNPGGSVYNRVLDLDWIYPPGWTEFFGGDVLVRRAALESVEGYNPELIAGEEPEMCRRLRGHLHNGKAWKILHIDHPMTQHDLRMTHFSQYWRRALRAGHAYAQVSGLFANTADPFWSAEAKRNRMRGTLLLGLMGLSLVAAVLLHAWWPPVALLALILVAAARSAYKVRSRSSSWVTLLFFGLHSHLQEIPIFIGQLRYRLAKARRKKMTLIEYKRA